jgi:outer membrane lipoprotein SlyB
MTTIAQPALAQTKCTNSTCGVVQRVELVEQKGKGTGLGAVAGGVAGGVLGHQIGSGRGNTAATIVGAGAGAYAGHKVEQSAKSTRQWNVAIRLDNGQTRTFSYSQQPTAREGERVRLVENGRRLAPVQ